MKAKTLFLLLALALLVTGCQSYQFHGEPYQSPQAAPAITGLDQEGRNFSLNALSGKVVLVFFGYTSCPDVCPTTLAEMRVLREALGDKADQVQVVYVSVDPERDTIARLKEYIPAFDPSFIGVHVNSIDLESIKQAYGVVAEKVYYNAQDTAAGYSVDHTARLYLIGPRGRLVASFPYGTSVESIQKDVEYLLSEAR